MSLSAQTHVQFSPFRWQDLDDKILLGRDVDRDWIVLDPAAAAIVDALDQGQTIEHVQGSLGATGGGGDVLAFTRKLEAIGFVESVGWGEHRGSGRVASHPAPTTSATWRTFSILTYAAVGYVIWAFAFGGAHWPAGVDLVLPGAPLGLALLALVAVASLTTLVHELGHIFVARQVGLAPRLSVDRAGLWAIARTSLVGVWALERRLRRRPVAAGLMADAIMLACAAGLSRAAVADSGPQHLAQLALAVLCARILWQLQWYLRTDVYFLFAVHCGAVDLRRAARLVLRAKLAPTAPARGRARSQLTGEPPSEITSARTYCRTLPIACAATIALAAWLMVPFALAVARQIV
jgi:hypothetical protein